MRGRGLLEADERVTDQEAQDFGRFKCDGLAQQVVVKCLGVGKVGGAQGDVRQALDFLNE